MYGLGAAARDSGTGGRKPPERAGVGWILPGHCPQGARTGKAASEETLTGAVPKVDSPALPLTRVPLTQAFWLQPGEGSRQWLVVSTPDLSHLLQPADGRGYSQASLVTS